MADNSSVPDTAIVSSNRVTETIGTLLHVAVNVERRFTVEQIATGSGVSKHTIRGYMRNEDRREPSLSNALSIAVVLGRNAVNAVLALIGYVGRPVEDEDDNCPMVLTAGALARLSIIAAAAADGRIDHIEAPGVRRATDELIQIVTPLSSAGDAA